MEQKFCRKCGNELGRGSKLCSECNTSINDVEPIVFKYGLAHTPNYFASKNFNDELDILQLLEPNLYNLRKYSQIPFYIAGIIAAICDIKILTPGNMFSIDTKLLIFTILAWILAAPHSFFLIKARQKGYKRMYNNFHTALFSTALYVTIMIPMFLLISKR